MKTCTSANILLVIILVLATILFSL